MDDVEEMDKFLETYNLPTLNHEEMENLNRWITSKGIESIIKNFPRNRIPVCTDKFYQTFKKRIKSNSSQTPKIQKKRELFQTHFTKSALL